MVRSYFIRPGGSSGGSSKADYSRAFKEMPTFAGGSSSKKSDSKKSSSSSKTQLQEKGINLYGKVQFEDFSPDLTIQYVSSFPDIKVEFVSSFQVAATMAGCGFVP